MTTQNKLTWIRSTSCSGGQCVEAATTAGDVLVRDSKRLNQDPISVPADVWADFTEALNRGDFRF